MRVWSVCSHRSCRVVSENAGRARIWTSPLLLSIISSHHSTLPHFCTYISLHLKKKGEIKWRQVIKTLKGKMLVEKRERTIRIRKSIIFSQFVLYRNTKWSHVYGTMHIFSQSIHSFSEWILVFFPLMNVEDHCVCVCEREDQQMIWGPIGGTGGLIHRFGSRQ